ncbi:hypothetical protein DFH06DRAFT_162084 [Mycena polygramma]|nr:hypothetical protein DFH06DRAFT_162084 [Mycena polygramma]
MDRTSHPNARSTSTSLNGNPGIVSSGMFSGAQNFTVTGPRSLKNITKNYALAAVPSDFRMIPLGDIDLQQEICLAKDTGVVSRRERSDRRVYSAKIRDKDFTVAMYQGDGAVEKWRQDLTKHSSLRHPNILQIYGAASSGGVHATVFHGDFPCLTAYIHGSCHDQFWLAKRYLYSIFQSHIVSSISTRTPASQLALNFQGPWQCTLWLRRSTGRLSVDLTQPDKPTSLHNSLTAGHTISEVPGLLSIHSLMMEAAVTDSLTLEDYHKLCYLYLPHFSSYFISAGVAVSLGAVVSQISSDHYVEIASLPCECFDFSDYWRLLRRAPASGAVLENGWRRFNTHDVVDCSLMSEGWLIDEARHWFSQANHIFNRCQITSNFNEYVLVDFISFHIEISKTRTALPTGFLFVCPPGAFFTGQFSYCWPECPAYWSLDPSGVERFTIEEAIELGFPTLQFSTYIDGRSWDSSVYAGLRKFHQAKGFDPYSQDVARHLGHHLYQPAANVYAPFAHIDDADASSEDDDQESAMDVDPKGTEESDENSSPMDLSW